MRLHETKDFHFEELGFKIILFSCLNAESWSMSLNSGKCLLFLEQVSVKMQ